MHLPAQIDVHTALSMTENMLRNGSLGNGVAGDYKLSVFFDVLAPAMPVFILAVSWSLSFFDRRRALRDAQLLRWCL
jgi:hypothetical protein